MCVSFVLLLQKKKKRGTRGAPAGDGQCVPGSQLSERPLGQAGSRTAAGRWRSPGGSTDALQRRRRHGWSLASDPLGLLSRNPPSSSLPAGCWKLAGSSRAAVTSESPARHKRESLSLPLNLFPAQSPLKWGCVCEDTRGKNVILNLHN